VPCRQQDREEVFLSVVSILPSLRMLISCEVT
jgi:hypothetical protein